MSEREDKSRAREKKSALRTRGYLRRTRLADTYAGSFEMLPSERLQWARSITSLRTTVERMFRNGSCPDQATNRVEAEPWQIAFAHTELAAEAAEATISPLPVAKSHAGRSLLLQPF
jgi:hypothetical protein